MEDLCMIFHFFLFLFLSKMKPSPSPSPKTPKLVQAGLFFGKGKAPVVVAPLTPAFDVPKMAPSAQCWGKFFNEFRYEQPELVPEACSKAATVV